jgi:transposase
MRRLVEGGDHGQTTLFPECLEDWIGEDNPARVVYVFVEELDLAELGVNPEPTSRPSCHPSVVLKLTSMAISIGFSRVGGLSTRLGATLR